MILFSDFHLDNHAEFGRPWRDGCNTRLQGQLEVLKRIFQVCEEREDYVLVFLGDWFHRWRSVDTTIASVVSRTLQQLLHDYHNVRLYMLPGNHDMPNKANSKVSTIDAYRAYPNVRVISEPEWLSVDKTFCAFVPYNQDHERMRYEAKALCRSREAYLFSHLDIVGAVASIDGYVSTGGVSLDDFDGYAGGFFGHYHMPQSWMTHNASEFHYIGSPMQLSWVDASTPPEVEATRGVIQFKNGIVTRIPIDSPKFVKITDDFKGDFRSQDYHLMTCKIEDADDARQKAQRMGIVENLRVMPVKEQKEGRAIVTRPTTAVDAIEAYVRARVGAGHDVDTLLGYGRYYLNGES